jgi:hypothetical protein
MPEGNIGDRAMASGHRRPGVEGPFARHIMSARQPVRSSITASTITGLPLVEPPCAVPVEELASVRCVHGSLSLGIAEEADGPDCDGTVTVIGFGDKWWSGAGCAGGARPVLRGGLGSIDMDEIM